MSEPDPVFSLSYSDLQAIHELTGQVCGWKMSLPTKMILQAQEVHRRMIKLYPLKPIMTEQTETLDDLKPMPESIERLSEKWTRELSVLNRTINDLLYVPVGLETNAKMFGRKQELKILLSVVDLWRNKPTPTSGRARRGNERVHVPKQV